MKSFFLIIVLLYSSLLFSQVNLETAYLKNSSKILTEKFEEWVKYSKPIASNDLENLFNIAKYTYEIFEDFYTPKSLTRIGESEWGDDIYKNIKYAFVQNEVIIEIYDSLLQISIWSNKYPEPLSSLKIIDFRPRVNIPGAKAIYLTKSIQEEIEIFLKDEFIPLGDNNIMSSASAKGESELRLEFINKHTKIFYGHWGGYWQIETYPTISIRFNKDLTKAEVDFILVYQGGTAFYERIKDRWKLKSSSITWIE